MKQSLTFIAKKMLSEIFAAIECQSHFIEQKPSGTAQNQRTGFRPEDYISIVKKLQQHILRGDCYEINFCQEFFATNAVIDPLICLLIPWLHFLPILFPPCIN